MRRRPLFPFLRVGLIIACASVLLCRPRRMVREAPPAPAAVWATDVNEWGPEVLRVGEKATKPLPGQKKPPCTPRREREVAGACWVATEHKPPCPAGIYEGAGRCLMPVRASQRPPTSVGE